MAHIALKSGKGKWNWKNWFTSDKKPKNKPTDTVLTIQPGKHGIRNTKVG